METKKIAIIGAGNMGGAIAVGLVKSGAMNASDIFVGDKNEKVLEGMKALGINTFSDNKEAVKNAEVVIVAVKPWLIKTVVDDLKSALSPKQIFSSIVAGVEIADLEEMVGLDMPVFRIMPNTAIALQESLTCLSSNNIAEPYRSYMVDLFNQLGKAVEIPESLMAATTAVSSCGIAYALRYIRASMEAGIQVGFTAKQAMEITAQTVKGAAELILQQDTHPEVEIDKVTTPKGITIAGLNEMEHKGFSSALIQGIMAAYKMME
jgi:pyrroline-5-carboxylate reductase